MDLGHQFALISISLIFSWLHSSINTFGIIWAMDDTLVTHFSLALCSTDYVGL